MIPLKNNTVKQYSFYSLGLVCFLYTVFTRHFAHLRFDLPFLKFPIFIGEIFMIIFFGLLFRGMFLERIFQKKYIGCVSIYFFWVLIMAVVGYKAYGPLAFRNAALFYYPVFFLFGYYFFDKRYLTKTLSLFVLAAVMSANLLEDYYLRYHYFNLTHAVILSVLAIRTDTKWLRVLIFLSLIILLPFMDFFSGSRSNLIAISATFIYVIMAVIAVGNFNFRIKWAICFLILVVCVSGVILKPNVRQKIGSLLTLNRIFDEYRRTKQSIDRVSDDYEMPDIPVHLFKSEKEVLFATPEGRLNGKQVLTSNNLRSEIINFVQSVCLPLKTILPVSAYDSLSGVFIDDLLSVSNKYNLYKGSKDALNIELENGFNERLDKVFIGESGEVKYLDREKYTTVKKELINKLMSYYYDSKDRFPKKYVRALSVDYNNVTFRFLIWDDMLKDMIHNRAVLGINWGKPQRSRNIEIVGVAKGEWKGVGWITPHNSFFHIIYRAGIIGVLLVLLMYYSVLRLTIVFYQKKSFIGLLLTSVFIYWIILSNFLVILEFPYTAIPLWSFAGVVAAYASKKGEI